MKYTPGRDYRFEYVTDVVTFVETYQCHDCAFKSDRPDYPMCFEVEGQLLVQDSDFAPVEELDDRGSDGVVCVRYRQDVLAEQEHPDQGRLI